MTSYLLRAALALLCAAPAAVQAAETINVGHFDSIDINGGGQVTLRHGATQSVVLRQGSTQYTSFRVKDGHTLRIDACNGTCPHNYALEIEITVPDIQALAINGGGSITASSFPGKKQITAAVNGGGEIDLTGMPVKDATAAVNGGGLIKVLATSDLTAAVMGGGEIAYGGHPQLTQVVQGGGSIERLD